MTQLPANIMQSVIESAKKLPAHTGAAERAGRAEMERAYLIVADVSASMKEAAQGGCTKIDCLREALRDYGERKCLAFSTGAQMASCANIPSPHGGTDLAGALKRAAKERPRAILVISDGEPDSEDAALAAANVFHTIDVLYIGRETNERAIDFMRRLARRRAGAPVMITHDLTRLGPHAFGQKIAGLLK